MRQESLIAHKNRFRLRDQSLKKRGKDEEKALFYNFITTSKSLAKASREKYTALELFLPAIQALASETIFNFSRKVN